MKPERALKLKILLEATLEEFVRSEEVQADALEPALKFKDWHDREMVAFICSVLAYGRVEHIKKSIHKVIDPMGESPHQWVLSATDKDIDALSKTWVHRFNTSQDLKTLLHLLKNIYSEFGSLEKFFDSQNHLGAFELIEKFVINIETKLKTIFSQPPKKNASFWFFFPRPSQGSACKRMNLFLRWMAGKGPADLRLWSSVGTNQLVIPLDVHVLNQARSLKLTRRKQADWKTVEEVTSKLRLLDPQDPTRFDFALCHLGMRGTILKNI